MTANILHPHKQRPVRRKGFGVLRRGIASGHICQVSKPHGGIATHSTTVPRTACVRGGIAEHVDEQRGQELPQPFLRPRPQPFDLRRPVQDADDPPLLVQRREGHHCRLQRRQFEGGQTCHLRLGSRVVACGPPKQVIGIYPCAIWNNNRKMADDISVGGQLCTVVQVHRCAALRYQDAISGKQSETVSRNPLWTQTIR